MKKPLIAFAAISFTTAMANFSVPASGKEPSLGCAALPWDMSQAEWDIGQKLPAFANKQKLIHELRSNGILFMPSKNFDEDQKYQSGEAFVGLGVKPWPYKPAVYIAVLETEMRAPTVSGGYQSTYHLLYTAQIKQDGSGFSVVAKTSEPIKLPPDYNFNKFDFANYKLSETDTAFGLRASRIEVFTGPGAPSMSVELLELLNQNGAKLERILSTPVLFENEPARHFDIATIQISKHSTNNFRDIIKTFRGKSTTFQWQDGFYKTKDADALATLIQRANPRFSP
jgi:hypothetical protein